MIDDSNITFSLNEIRPETSKSSRGTVKKMNKTQSNGFWTPCSIDGEGNQIQPSSNPRIIMNTTGFAFRGGGSRVGISTESGNGTKSLGIDIIAQTTLTQSFHKSRKQNSLQTGTTLDQYFQAPSQMSIIEETQLQIGGELFPSVPVEVMPFEQLQSRDGVSQYLNGQEIVYDSEKFEIHEEEEEQEDDNDSSKDSYRFRVIQSSSSKMSSSAISQRKKKPSSSRLRQRLSSQTSQMDDSESNKRLGPSVRGGSVIQPGTQNTPAVYLGGSSYRKQSNDMLDNPANTSNVSNQQIEFTVDNNPEETIQQRIREKYFKKTIQNVKIIGGSASQLNVNQMNSQQIFPATHVSNHHSDQIVNSQISNNALNSSKQSSREKVQITSTNYPISSVTSRQSHRSQSPLRSLKQQTNNNNSQAQQHHRQSSKDQYQQFSPSPPDYFVDDCRKTFLREQQNAKGQGSYNFSINASTENRTTFRTSFYSKPPHPTYSYQLQGQANNFSTNQLSQNRQTQNEFYKSTYPNAVCASATSVNGTLGGQYRNDDFIVDAMLRRTTKESKFLNQKEKIVELAKEDENYLTKHAARFNLNPTELASIRQRNNFARV